MYSSQHILECCSGTITIKDKKIEDYLINWFKFLDLYKSGNLSVLLEQTFTSMQISFPIELNNYRRLSVLNQCRFNIKNSSIDIPIEFRMYKNEILLFDQDNPLTKHIFFVNGSEKEIQVSDSLFTPKLKRLK